MFVCFIRCVCILQVCCTNIVKFTNDTYNVEEKGILRLSLRMKQNLLVQSHVTSSLS